MHMRGAARSMLRRCGRHTVATAALHLATVLAALFFTCNAETGIEIYFQSSESSLGSDAAAAGKGIQLRTDLGAATGLDLGLLGAATGMCADGVSCDMCKHRDTNPCQVVDGYGADTALCQLPAFLGGAVMEDMLCGMGATAEVRVPHLAAALAPAATLTAFRTRDGQLVLTLTARCGWVLVPSLSQYGDGTTARSGGEGAGDGSDGGSGVEGALGRRSLLALPRRQQQEQEEGREEEEEEQQRQPVPQWVMLEGEVSYSGSSAYFAAPAQATMQEDEQQPGGGEDGEEQPGGEQQAEVAAGGGLAMTGTSADGSATAGSDGSGERYSCFSAVLPLSGLSSSCGSVEVALRLRLALRRVALRGPGAAADAQRGGGSEAEEGEEGEEADAWVECEEEGSVVSTEVELVIRPPQLGRRVQQAVAAATEEQLRASAEVRQQLFSNGVAASTSYAATLDPRTPESSAWLESLTRSFPLLAAARTHHSLSFLVGTLRGASPSSPSSSPSAGQHPGALLPAGLSLDSCGAKSIGLVTTAVLSALSAQGVTDRHVADVVCLQPPYLSVPGYELPPCARETLVLFNVSLEIPLTGGGSGGSNVVPVATDGSSSTSIVVSASGSGSGAASAVVSDPRDLADTLVAASFAAPWTCLSTEGQMRMSSTVQLSVQLPKAPGAAEDPALDASLLLPGLLSPAPGAGGSSGGGGGSNTAAPAPAPSAAASSLGAAEVAAVAVAVTLAVVVALIAFFAIRYVRGAKRSARVAQDAAVAAAAVTTAAAAAVGPRASGGGASSGDGPLLGKLSLPVPPPPPPPQAAPSFIEAEGTVLTVTDAAAVAVAAAAELLVRSSGGCSSGSSSSSGSFSSLVASQRRQLSLTQQGRSSAARSLGGAATATGLAAAATHSGATGDSGSSDGAGLLEVRIHASGGGAILTSSRSGGASVSEGGASLVLVPTQSALPGIAPAALTWTAPAAEAAAAAQQPTLASQPSATVAPEGVVLWADGGAWGEGDGGSRAGSASARAVAVDWLDGPEPFTAAVTAAAAAVAAAAAAKAASSNRQEQQQPRKGRLLATCQHSTSSGAVVCVPNPCEATTAAFNRSMGSRSSSSSSSESSNVHDRVSSGTYDRRSSRAVPGEPALPALTAGAGGSLPLPLPVAVAAAVVAAVAAEGEAAVEGPASAGVAATVVYPVARPGADVSGAGSWAARPWAAASPSGGPFTEQEGDAGETQKEEESPAMEWQLQPGVGSAVSHGPEAAEAAGTRAEGGDHAALSPAVQPCGGSSSNSGGADGGLDGTGGAALPLPERLAISAAAAPSETAFNASAATTPPLLETADLMTRVLASHDDAAVAPLHLPPPTLRPVRVTAPARVAAGSDEEAANHEEEQGPEVVVAAAHVEDGLHDPWFQGTQSAAEVQDSKAAIQRTTDTATNAAANVAGAAPEGACRGKAMPDGHCGGERVTSAAPTTAAAVAASRPEANPVPLPAGVTAAAAVAAAVAAGGSSMAAAVPLPTFLVTTPIVAAAAAAMTAKCATVWTNVLFDGRPKSRRSIQDCRDRSGGGGGSARRTADKIDGSGVNGGSSAGSSSGGAADPIGSDVVAACAAAVADADAMHAAGTAASVESAAAAAADTVGAAVAGATAAGGEGDSPVRVAAAEWTEDEVAEASATCNGATADSATAHGATADSATAHGAVPVAHGDAAHGDTADGDASSGNAAHCDAADGNAADGDAADGDAADGDAADGDVANGDAADGDATDGDAADGNAADGATVDGATADSPTADGAAADGATADPATADGAGIVANGDAADDAGTVADVRDAHHSDARLSSSPSGALGQAVVAHLSARVRQHHASNERAAAAASAAASAETGAVASANAVDCRHAGGSSRARSSANAVDPASATAADVAAIAAADDGTAGAMGAGAADVENSGVVKEWTEEAEEVAEAPAADDDNADGKATADALSSFPSCALGANVVAHLNARVKEHHASNHRVAAVASAAANPGGGAAGAAAGDLRTGGSDWTQEPNAAPPGEAAGTRTRDMVTKMLESPTKRGRAKGSFRRSLDSPPQEDSPTYRYRGIPTATPPVARTPFAARAAVDARVVAAAVAAASVKVRSSGDMVPASTVMAAAVPTASAPEPASPLIAAATEAGREAWTEAATGEAAQAAMEATMEAATAASTIPKNRWMERSKSLRDSLHTARSSLAGALATRTARQLVRPSAAAGVIAATGPGSVGGGSGVNMCAGGIVSAAAEAAGAGGEGPGLRAHPSFGEGAGCEVKDGRTPPDFRIAAARLAALGPPFTSDEGSIGTLGGGGGGGVKREGPQAGGKQGWRF